MEKQNLMGFDSLPESVRDYPLVLAKYAKDNLPLNELYEKFITDSIEVFKKKKQVCPFYYFVFRDEEEGLYAFMAYPLSLVQGMDKKQSMVMHSLYMKNIVKAMKMPSKTSNFKLVGLLSMVTAHAIILPLEDGIDVAGRPKYKGAIAEDPNHKDMVIFDYEDYMFKTTRAFEYIQSDNGDIVINPKPKIERKSSYNRIEAENSLFGFFLAEDNGADLN